MPAHVAGDDQVDQVLAAAAAAANNVLSPSPTYWSRIMSFSTGTQKLIDSAFAAKDARDTSLAKSAADNASKDLAKWAQTASREHAAVDEKALAAAIAEVQTAIAADLHAPAPPSTPALTPEGKPDLKPVVPAKRG
jgi:hypothetical protein